MKKSRRKKRPACLKVWISAFAIVAALFIIGNDTPELRRVLEEMLQDLLNDEPAKDSHAGNVRVIDGDTLDVAGTRVRLYGIDAPEAAQACRRRRRGCACGADATKALVQKIGGRSVQCEQQDKDRYGRVVGICYVGSQNLNAWMVQNGWAGAYRQYGGRIYDPVEATARRRKRAIWSSEFVMPWDWRKGQR